MIELQPQRGILLPFDIHISCLVFGTKSILGTLG